MKKRVFFLLLMTLLTGMSASARVWQIQGGHWNQHWYFGPHQLGVNAGDTLEFILEPGISVVEVSEATYASQDTTWNGGFVIESGGGIAVVTTPGFHYFVCPQHVLAGMMGEVYVTTPSITVTSLAPLTACAGADITLSFTALGAYYWGNIFEVQLSDPQGSFAVPVTIVSIPLDNVDPFTGICWTVLHDTLAVTLRNNLAPGAGYRVRVVSPMHGVTGTPSALSMAVHPSNPTTLVWTGASSLDWSTAGNWDNPCAIPTPGDTVIVNAGNGPPALVPSIMLGKLVLNNPAGLTLSGDLEISGNLTLSDGVLSLGNANLTLAGTADITGGSAASFVRTSGSGELRIEGIGSGTRSSMRFPVGAASSVYTPLEIGNSGTADAFRVRVADDVRTGGWSGIPLNANVVGKTWFISEAQPGESDAQLTFTWNPADELYDFDRTACIAAHYENGHWVPLQSAAAAAGQGPFTLTVSGVTSFSPFAIGDGDAPFPVVYRSLSAEVVANSVVLRWTTESEHSCRGFSVERRADAADSWLPVTFIESAGGTAGPQEYRCIDAPPHAGAWFYRLRQIDHDGRETLSPALLAKTGDPDITSPTELEFESPWPNPFPLSVSRTASASFRAALGGHAVLTLHNLLGQRVRDLYDAAVEGGSRTTVRFDVGDLPPGVYICRLNVDALAASRLLVLQR